MFRLFACFLIASAVAASGEVSPGNPAHKLPAEAFQAIMAQHCHRCHGGEKTKGKVDLVALQQPDDLRQHPELMETMVSVLRDGEMPPEDEPPLAEGELEQLTAYLDQMLGRSLSSEPYEPTPIRRMNRFQYNNAVVDLLEREFAHGTAETGAYKITTTPITNAQYAAFVAAT
ncbi:MAG: c-type cytochrome, partial [Verrucomicrobiota bacterium]